MVVFVSKPGCCSTLTSNHAKDYDGHMSRRRINRSQHDGLASVSPNDRDERFETNDYAGTEA
jgi:hypothetical protein